MTLPQERLENLSVFYFIQGLFTGTPIRVVSSFPTEELTLPTVAVRTGKIYTYPFETGNRVRKKLRVYYLDIFALTEEQRDDIGYTIINALETPITVYNYNEGFPPYVPSTQGCLVPEDIDFEPIEIIPELVTTMYYRALVTYTALNNKF